MMGMAKQLGGELLGSALAGKKHKEGGSGKEKGEMSDSKALKEALKLAKHKGKNEFTTYTTTQQ